MNFEIISLVIESLLALAAVIIATIQLIGEMRERKAVCAKEEQRRKEKIKVIEIVRWFIIDNFLQIYVTKA